MARQIQEGVRGDRNHGEPQPGSAGERLTCARGRALSGPQLEKRGEFQRFFFCFFSPCLYRLLMLCFLSRLSTPAHLCNPLQRCQPLVALYTPISSILTSVSLSESNYFFPAAVTPLSEMIKLSSYIFLDSVSPLGS